MRKIDASWWMVLLILLVGLSPLWLWALDNILHFGYGGDK